MNGVGVTEGWGSGTGWAVFLALVWMRGTLLVTVHCASGTVTDGPLALLLLVVAGEGGQVRDDCCLLLSVLGVCIFMPSQRNISSIAVSVCAAVSLSTTIYWRLELGGYLSDPDGP